ncbi:hypothetical protein Cni_G12532 [Canna indica]|uniref:Protein WEAK CHLOROPLAST MOVEMENT UNDER BLUE LIGHT 1-like n=1 Tax=Canna indica TaxID=4628 RepID=A0AAQ3KC08_9LILI|nr:hypothetical protein Cni_G12532 [Canna indica]
MNGVETKIEQYFSDPSANKKLKDTSENYEISIKHNFLDATSQHTPIAEDSDSHHQDQKVVDESESLILQDIPDAPTVDMNKSNTIKSSNLPGSSIGDAVVVSEITVGLPSHSTERSQEEPSKITHYEDEICVKVDATKISNGSSASNGKRITEQIPSMPPSEHIDHRDIEHIQENPPNSDKLYKHRKDHDAKRSLVDTTARLESVKEVVTKFGGIIDWKAHKVHTLEKCKHLQYELERIQDDIAECKRESEAAEVAKVQVQMELESTKQIIEELKMKLERAEKEDTQAQQDSELARLRIKEIEQGIAHESSIAAKAQLDVAKERHRAAVAELKSVKMELKALQGECVLLINERDAAMSESAKAVSKAKETEKRVEELALELISNNQLLESAHAAYLDAEEHKIGAALARDQDCLTWEQELRQAEEEVQRLNQQLISTKDLKVKLDASSALLLKLKDELEAYMKEKSKQESETIDDVEETKGTFSSIQSLAPTKKALEEAKTSIEKTKNEINHLKVSTSSLKSEIDAEKAALMALKQREGMASIVVSSLEAELDRTKQELEEVRIKEKESREKMVELPKLLPRAALEADQAKAVAQVAREELGKSKKEAEQSKAAASTTQIKLHAAFKEIEAAKASEKQALTTIKALQETEQAAKMRDNNSPIVVSLPLDEYLTLSKKANEVEELAHEKVAAALAQIELAKKSELNSLKRLEETYREMARRKEALEAAVKKVEKARDEKLGAEQELRKWRAELEQQRKANDTAKAAISPPLSSPTSFHQQSEIKINSKEESDVLVQPESQNAEQSVLVKKKKKSLFFPRILLFLARRKR